MKSVSASTPTEASIPSLVLACKSEPYFSAALREHGSAPLVMTRDYVAPEGYAVEALVEVLGENASPREVRARVARTYAR